MVKNSSYFFRMRSTEVRRSGDYGDWQQQNKWWNRQCSLPWII